MSKRYEWYMGTQEIIDNETREFVDAIEVIDSLEEELKEQKEKYDHLYSCYKKTSSEDLQDKYRLAEENEQNLKNMFNAYSKILEEKDKKIKDLETKLAEKEKELVVKEQSRLDWKERAIAYGDLIVSLNNILPNKQKEEITFSKVIEDVKDLIIKQSDELTGRKKLCDLRYNQLKQAHQEKIEFAVKQLSLLKSQIIEKRRLYKGKFSEFSNGINDALFDVEEDIDNLVEELTHQHEDKGEYVS